MVFIVLGVLLLVLKLAELNPVAEWSWLLVLSPFALAVAWWIWLDKSGRTSRAATLKDQARKDERRRNLAQGLGLRGVLDRSVSNKLSKAEEKEQSARQRKIEKIERERERIRQANRDSILTTRMDSKFDSRFDAPAAQGPGPGEAAGKVGAP